MLALLADKTKFKGKGDLKKQKKTLKHLIAFVEEVKSMVSYQVIGLTNTP